MVALRDPSDGIGPVTSQTPRMTTHETIALPTQQDQLRILAQDAGIRNRMGATTRVPATDDLPSANVGSRGRET